MALRSTAGKKTECFGDGGRLPFSDCPAWAVKTDSANINPSNRIVRILAKPGKERPRNLVIFPDYREPSLLFVGEKGHMPGIPVTATGRLSPDHRRVRGYAMPIQLLPRFLLQ